MSREPSNRPLWSRLAWMAAIWSLSVVAVAAVSLVIRVWLKP